MNLETIVRNYEQKKAPSISGLNTLDEFGTHVLPYEWSTTDLGNKTFALYNRMMKRKVPPDPEEVKTFRSFAQPII